MPKFSTLKVSQTLSFPPRLRGFLLPIPPSLHKPPLLSFPGVLLALGPVLPVVLLYLSLSLSLRASAMGNPPRPRKRVDAEATPTLKRAKDGSAFSRCESCNKDVPVVLIDMHSCTLDATIKMKFESQIEERPAVSKNPPERKKKTVSSEKKDSKRKRSSKERDPNMPKRPSTAFFVFMDEFRKKYKEENPEDAKSVAKVAKEGGEKWKSMTTEEKKQFVDKAAELKAEYEKAMEKYSSEKPTEKEDEAVDSSNEE